MNWSDSQASALLSEDSTHLWYSSLDLPELSLVRLQASLDADERERAQLFCSERERARFIAGHGLLRKILEYYVGVPSSELQLCYNPQGKPSLTERFGGNRIQFNLAHSGGFAIYAVTLDRRIGVDLERIAPFADLQQFADRFFSEREKAVLHGLVGDEKLEAFFKLWTAKEAYLKGRGNGFTLPLDKIEVPLIGSSMFHGVSCEDSRWSLEQLRPALGFAAAVVVEECRKQEQNEKKISDVLNSASDLELVFNQSPLGLGRNVSKHIVKIA